MAANWDPDNIGTPVAGKHAGSKSRRRTTWGVAVLFAFVIGLVALLAWARVPWEPSEAPVTTGAVPPALPPVAPATQP